MWKDKLPTLRISPPGSDFCDECVELQDRIDHADMREKPKLLETLHEHKSAAQSERASYGSIRDRIKHNEIFDTLHLVLDFAEKVHYLIWSDIQVSCTI